MEEETTETFKKKIGGGSTDWCTEDELRFIDGLGHGRYEEPTNRPTVCPHTFTKSRKENASVVRQGSGEPGNLGKDGSGQMHSLR